MDQQGNVRSACVCVYLCVCVVVVCVYVCISVCVCLFSGVCISVCVSSHVWVFFREEEKRGKKDVKFSKVLSTCEGVWAHAWVCLQTLHTKPNWFSSVIEAMKSDACKLHEFIPKFEAIKGKN